MSWIKKQLGSATIGIIGTVFTAIASTTGLLALAYNIVILPIKDTQNTHAQQIIDMQKDVNTELNDLNKQVSNLDGKLNILLQINGIKTQSLTK